MKSTIKEVNTGKPPGLDGIHTTVYIFIFGVWHGEPVPLDWVDAIMLCLLFMKARFPSLTMETNKT